MRMATRFLRRALVGLKSRGRKRMRNLLGDEVKDANDADYRGLADGCTHRHLPVARCVGKIVAEG